MNNQSNIGKRWRAYSKRNKNFDVSGYTEPGDDYKEDAIKAMELLSKHFREPIPDDVELALMGTNQ